MTLYPPPAQPQSGGRLRWVLIGIGAGLSSLVLCCALLAFGGWQLFSGVIDETTAIQQVVRDFMDAGRRQDIAAAEALFADAGGVSVSRDDLERLFNNRQLFREVEGTSLRSFNISSNTEETTAEIAGTLNYTDGGTQPFSARLLKEGDQWRLVRIDFR
ncbi:hypothetical protein [Chloroflexus sp.]|uniref:hypothetical protein n=1 Tax=Chloroflexus sp. TaxID=1904827 RepID=UPI002ADDDEEA|nr:hypothetical protein [Chloroflexus sp.]